MEGPSDLAEACGAFGWPRRSLTSTRQAAPLARSGVMAELRHGRAIALGHNSVSLIMRQLGIKGLPTRRLPKGARVAAVTSGDLMHRDFRRDGPTSCGRPTSPSTRPARARSTAASSSTRYHAICRVVDRLDADHHADPQRRSAWRSAGAAARTGCRAHSDRGVQFISWASSQTVRDAGTECRRWEPSAALTTMPWSKPSGPHASRAAQPPDAEDAHRACHRDPRLHRAMSQQPTPPQHPRCAKALTVAE
jgi:hypothetical protein